MLAALSISAFAAGCGKFDTASRLASTPATFDGTDRRLWAVTRGGILYSIVLLSDGSARWTNEGSSTLGKAGGVSATTWTTAATRHERAYFVSIADELITRQRDGASEAWVTTAAPSNITLRGPTAAVSIVTSSRMVAGIGDLDGGGERVVLFTGSGSPETTYSVDVRTPPSALAMDTPIAGASSQVSACFVMRTSAGHLLAFDGGASGWRVSAPPSGTLAGALAIYGVPAAAPSIGGDYTVFARTSSGEVLMGNLGGCLANATWTSLGAPPSGVHDGMFALDAGREGAMTTLAAAANNGLLYTRVQSSAGGAFSAWTSRTGAGDTLGALGAVHVVTAAGRVVYVGDVSTGSAAERAGYSFESPGASSPRNYLDPTAIISTVNEPDTGAWTESFAAERRGKVVAASVVVDATSADYLRKHWVHVTLSEDDGHRWGAPRPLERCYPVTGLPAPSCGEVPSTPGATSISGDPWAAVDTSGNRFASFHEISANNCGTAGPAIYSSRVSVYRLTPDTMVRETGSTYVYDSTTGSASEPYYVDHPALATTGDGRTHLFWYNKQYTGSSTERTRLLYRSRTAAAVWSAPVELFMEETGGRSGLGPYPAVAGDSTLIAAWSDVLPTGGTQIRVCRMSGTACSSIVDTSNTGASCINTSHPTFGTSNVRSTPYAIAGHPSDPQRFYLAYQRAEAAASACPASGTGASSVVLSQSTDGGATWTAPVTVSPAGSDEFNVGLAVISDGTVFVSYFQRPDTASGTADPMVSTCAACSATPAPSDFVAAPAPGASPLDMASLPHKCGGDSASSVFLGDYHGTTGGGSRAHLIRIHAGGAAPMGRLEYSTISRFVRR